MVQALDFNHGTFAKTYYLGDTVYSYGRRYWTADIDVLSFEGVI
jgi:hypothetical protein